MDAILAMLKVQSTSLMEMLSAENRVKKTTYNPLFHLVKYYSIQNASLKLYDAKIQTTINANLKLPNATGTQ